MNHPMIRYILGRILILEAGLMVPSVLTGLIYGESLKSIGAFLLTMALLLLIGLFLGFRPPEDQTFYTKEGLVVTAMSWILMSFFGGLPFYFAGEIPSLVDCFFEMSSGFTTTGSSIIPDVEVLSRSLLFWRSFSHFVGGMGVLVFALAVLPKAGATTVHLMRAEVPGPTFGKLVSKIRDTARILYLIYTVMTLVCVLMLVLAGMPLFDALLHAFGTAGTGGFGIKAASIGHYQSNAISLIIGTFMLLFGVNFTLYYLALTGHLRDALKSQELRWYILIVFIAVIVIVAEILPTYDSLKQCVIDVYFTVSSIITTTGYATADFATWPMYSRVVLMMLMFIGACAGSTAGGLKVSRVVAMFQMAKAEVKRFLNPRRVVSVQVEGKPLNDEGQRSIGAYFIVYMIIFSFLLLIVSFGAPNFITAFSAVAATFNNIGPGMDIIGPKGNFSVLSDVSKLLLSFGMLAGRLEIFPILALFMPETWKRK